MKRKTTMITDLLKMNNFLTWVEWVSTRDPLASFTTGSYLIKKDRKTGKITVLATLKDIGVIAQLLKDNGHSDVKIELIKGGK